MNDIEKKYYREWEKYLIRLGRNCFMCNIEDDTISKRQINAFGRIYALSVCTSCTLKSFLEDQRIVFNNECDLYITIHTATHRISG